MKIVLRTAIARVYKYLIILNSLGSDFGPSDADESEAVMH